MKTNGLISTVLVFIALFLCKPTFGQISQNLYQPLPDSLRPKKRENVTIKEFQKILNNVLKIKGWSINEFQEVDSLCHRFGPMYSQIANKQERLKFLKSVCSALYAIHNLYASGTPQATGRNISSRTANFDFNFSTRYTDIYIDELKKYTPLNKLALSSAYFCKSFFCVENDNFLEAEKYRQLSLALAKEMNKTDYIGKIYMAFAYTYNLLGLSNQALTYCDSARTAITMSENNSKVATNERATIISYKQKAYLTLFIQQGRSTYADSIKVLHKQLTYDTYTHGRRKASSFIILAGLNFYQQKYVQSLAYLDSAQRSFPDLKLLVLWQEGQVYKGVSLMKLNREQDAKKVLDQLNFANIQAPATALALQELVAKEERSRNQDGVLYYQHLLLTFNQKRHEVEMQGRALEMAGKYNLATRDAQILQLTILKERERWITLFVVLSIALLLVFLLIRYRNSTARTNRLVQQIDEITALHITQIEEVQALERKRIGQELHDELASSIAMASRYLQLKADQSNDTPDKQQTIQVAKALEESYNVTRMKSHRLFQEDNARQFCDRLAANTELLFVGTPIQFTFTGEINGLVLSAEFKTVLVLVIKEAMTNIIKHANASQVDVLLYYEAESLVLTISDNGKGISTSQFTKGIGMKTIQSRIASLGGTLAISEADPTGTILEIHIPIMTEDMHSFDGRLKQAYREA